MIEAMKRGFHGSQARLVCDDCGRGAVVTCDYIHGPGHEWKPNEGQALKKAAGMKWTHVRGVLRCLKCEARRKKPKPREAVMPENVTTLRQPTRDQKRQIVSLLTDVYDTEAGRYRRGETDKTVAECLGDGIMPGWVANIREELFGPDGGSAEMEALLADLKTWRGEIDATAARLHEALAKLTAELRGLNDAKAKADEHLKRIEAIKAAVGPKVARA